MNNTINHKTQHAAPEDFSVVGLGKFEVSVFVFLLIAGILTYFFTRRHARKERHATIYETFHESLIPAIQILSKDPGTFKPEDFTKFTDTFHAQEANAIKIKDSLSERNLKSFSSEWIKYQKWQKTCDNYKSTVMVVAMESKRKQVLELVTEILKIAKN